MESALFLNCFKGPYQALCGFMPKSLDPNLTRSIGSKPIGPLVLRSAEPQAELQFSGPSCGGTES
jgi:hypothetical protein